MAQYQLSEPDDLIECPYNSAHLVRALRFPYHLIKCRKNNPNMKYAVCPFNARHEMPYAELRFHIARCIDRTMLEHDLARAQSCVDSGHVKGDTSVPAYDDASDTAPTEDWDTESTAYSRLQDSASNRKTKPTPREGVQGDARGGSTGEARVHSLGNTRVNSVGDLRMDSVNLVGQQKHNERNSNKESHSVKQSVRVHDDAPTRQPRGLPLVLQMAQQSRLSNVEKQDAKCDTSTENDDIPAAPPTDTLPCDSRRKQELLLQSLARGRGRGQGTITPSVGYAARKLTSARGRGIALNVGRGVMCLSQFPDT